MYTSRALKVAARYQKRLADVIGDPQDLLRKFEAVVEKVAEYEKDIPWIQDAQKLKETEAKSWTFEEMRRLRDIGDPRIKLISDLDRYQAKLAVLVKFSSRYFAQVDARNLFLGILQQLDLPPKIRKSIEAAAKYHAKNRQGPKHDVALKAYIDLLATVRGQLAAAKEALLHGKPRGGGGEEAPRGIKVGPFDVINTGGFDEKTMADVASVVGKAAQLLQAKGLHRVLYGDVLISRTLSSANVLAFYLIEKDELFVRANLRGKQHDALLTICHELGHRLQFKFLRNKEAEIQGIYNQIARKFSVGQRDRIKALLEKHPIVPGETVVEGGKLYEVVGPDWKGTNRVVRLVRPEEKKTLEEEGFSKNLKTYVMPLEAYYLNKGFTSYADMSGFITPYAKTSASENFAEMVSHWCVDKLPEDQVELLKALL